MADILEEMMILEDAARRCIPRLAADPVLIKCEFKPAILHLLDVEYHSTTSHKVVILNQCGDLNFYIAEALRELLAEEGIDAWVAFK